MALHYSWSRARYVLDHTVATDDLVANAARFTHVLPTGIIKGVLPAILYAILFAMVPIFLRFCLKKQGIVRNR